MALKVSKYLNGDSKVKAKKEPRICEALGLIWQRPTFPLGIAVSSAMQGLTSLFGMVRGVHLLYNHQKYLLRSFL